jgi:ribosomal protein S1
MVDNLYHVGQLVTGVVSRTAQFGAFISLDPGIEALLHASQISEPPPSDASDVIREGEILLMRVISIEPEEQRLGLSLKEVTDEEKERWTQQQFGVVDNESDLNEVHDEADVPVTEVDESVEQASV